MHAKSLVYDKKRNILFSWGYSWPNKSTLNTFNWMIISNEKVKSTFSTEDINPCIYYFLLKYKWNSVNVFLLEFSLQFLPVYIHWLWSLDMLMRVITVGLESLSFTIRGRSERAARALCTVSNSSEGALHSIHNQWKCFGN